MAPLNAQLFGSAIAFADDDLVLDTPETEPVTMIAMLAFEGEAD
jgi:hypothetical protein